MKKLSFFLIAVGALIAPVVSCKVDYLEPKDSQRIEALLNGQPWKAHTTIRALRENKDNSEMAIGAYTKEGYSREEIIITGFSVSEENEHKDYRLMEIDSFLEGTKFYYGKECGIFFGTWTGHGDLFTGAYDPVDCQDVETVFSITSIRGRMVEGRLSGCFVKSGGNDTITIENGQFEAKIDWQ